MSKIPINILNEIDDITYILQTKNFANLGIITNIHDSVYKNNFNSYNELSFTVEKYNGDIEMPLWNRLNDFKVLYIPELDERFEITVDLIESTSTTKSITCTSNSEAELSNTILRNIEINNDTDYANDLYDVNIPTILYRPLLDYCEVNGVEYGIQKVLNDIIADYESEKITYEQHNKTYYENLKTDPERFTIFKQASLIHRLLDKTPHFTIKHVDDSLYGLTWIRSFSINGSSVYDTLMGEISEQYGLHFEFDKDRGIYVYDMMNTCDVCGYRGDFDSECPNELVDIVCNECEAISEDVSNDTCPECGSKNINESNSHICGSTSFHGRYGNDTTVFISAENLAEELQRNGSPQSVKTLLYVEGGDELMTAAILAVSPTGSNKIYNIPDYMMEDMSDSLKDKLESYKELEEEYNTQDYELDDDIVDSYNELVASINELTKGTYDRVVYTEISNPLHGYSAVSSLWFELIDLDGLLQSSLAPSIKSACQMNKTIDETKDYLEDVFVDKHSGIYVEDVEKETVITVNTLNTVKTTVTNKVKNYIKCLINTSLYSFEITNDSYTNNNNVNGTWKGDITITEIKQNDDKTQNVRTLSNVTLTVSSASDDIEQFIHQKIALVMEKKDVNDIIDMTNVYSDATETQVANALKYYSMSYLNNLLECFDACIDIIASLKTNEDLGEVSYTEDDGTVTDLYSHYYGLYNKRQELINAEILVRQEQLDIVHTLYNNSYTETDGYVESGIIYDIISEVKDDMSLEDYLGDDYQEFRYYIREDTYTNSNYVSDGLNNSQLMYYARRLLSDAKQELNKNSYNQYSISTKINNLLILKEFAPLRSHFKVGNWIRVEIDDVIYKLRLLSYQLEFDSPENMSVEFSTVINAPGFVSDWKSILSSASSLSGSINYLQKQMGKTNEIVNDVANWKENGIKADAIEYASDEKGELILSDHSLLARQYDDDTEEYEPYQLKIVKNGLYITDDSWETISAAIGKYSYTDENGQNHTTIGVLGDTVYGDLIIGDNLKIANDSDTLTFDEDGLTVKNGNTSVNIDPSETNIFEITKDGTAVMSATTDGEISIGTANNYLKFYKQDNGTYKMKVCASEIEFGGEDLEDRLENSVAPARIEIETTNGNLFKHGNIATTLIAHVYRGNTDITSEYNDSDFYWEKYDQNGLIDEEWCSNHTGVRQIVITRSDVYNKASFNCKINDEE